MDNPIKPTFLFLSVLIALIFIGRQTVNAQEIKIPHATELSKTTFKLGTATNPKGESILCDSRSLLINGKPAIPVMGEIHYTRVNENDWKRELLKMKAGGITMVATYVIWIHHEEEKGIFDWSKTRDLNRFVETCKEVDLPVILRIGPFCHGEVRNGGLPEWVVDGSYKFRSTDSLFIDQVRIWYSNIYNQVKGNLWKDGGPIIGIQLDNEFRGPWAYLKTLKEMAVTIGFDVPIYTRTGWPELRTPATFGEILPLYGDYCDGFWDRTLKDMPGKYPGVYLFNSSRISNVIASEQFPADMDNENKASLSYPFLTCELGGGMMPSYHRRINIQALDIHAMTIVKIGSGSNLPGYYMYHGGTNPKGIDYYLNEKQATLYMSYNDMPAMNYDFQAPLGEFGQVNDQYHWLRRTHSFLADFGEELTGMDLVQPENTPTDANAEDELRWAVRSNGTSGYIFVNNYQRMRQLSDKKDVQFTLQLPNEKLTFPKKPTTIPSGASFFVPFNIKVDDLTINYATAQPVAKIKNGSIETIFLAEVKGIPVELMLEGDYTIASKKHFEKVEDGFLFENLQAGFDCIIDATSSKGKTIRIIVLDEESSLQSYTIKTTNKEYLFVSPAVVSTDKNEVYLEQWNQKDFEWMVYPEAEFEQQEPQLKKTINGLVAHYQLKQSNKIDAKLTVEKIRDASAPRIVNLGKQKVAEQPSEADFETLSSEWKIAGLDGIKNCEDYFLKITYQGDVARVYANGELVDDNFYNGKPMYVRVSSLIGKEVRLNILPLKQDYPIYFQADIREILKASEMLLKLSNVELVKRNTLKVDLK